MSSVAGPHPSQLRVVSVGCRVAGSTTQAFTIGCFGLVKLPLTLQRSGEHQPSFRRVQAFRESPSSRSSCLCVASKITQYGRDIVFRDSALRRYGNRTLIGS